MRDRFTSTKASGITVAIRRPYGRPTDATYRCKIPVDISNQLSGKPVRISNPYFVFDKSALLKPDQKWLPEHGTGRIRMYFFTPQRGMHESEDVYLRQHEKTDTWIAIDPRQQDYEIDQASGAKRIGRLYFQITRWTDSGNAKTRWVRKKL